MTPSVIFVFLIASRTYSVKSVLGSATRSMSRNLKHMERRRSEVKGVKSKVRSPKEGMSKVRGPRRGMSKERSPKAESPKVSRPRRRKSKVRRSGRRRAKVRRPR